VHAFLCAPPPQIGRTAFQSRCPLDAGAGSNKRRRLIAAGGDDDGSDGEEAGSGSSVMGSGAEADRFEGSGGRVVGGVPGGRIGSYIGGGSSPDAGVDPGSCGGGGFAASGVGQC
jgi:hypothetical protein